MNILFLSLLTIFLSITGLLAQNTITGSFPALNNQQIKLVGFDGFTIYTIDSVKANNIGDFKLHFNNKDFGMGYLVAEDNKSFIVILGNENMQLKGESFAFPESILISNSRENQLFGKYATEHPRREQALSAWDYLEKIYRQDSLFALHKKPNRAIEVEKQRINKEDQEFLEGLDPKNYVRWFLPVRKLVSSVSTIAQYRTKEIPATMEAFRKLDYTDHRLFKSGLLRETIEAHFWLIENTGRQLDSVYLEMSISIDRMIENLKSDEKKLNEVTEYLFKLLERRSLFQASEYLALKLLNEKSCTLNSDFSSQLESYRAMRKGNTAPDFAFNDDLLAPGYLPLNLPNKLSDIKSKYTVVVFGASWCNACSEELASITNLYQKWKNYDLEVLFVSLDEEKQSFKNFSTKIPFISVCDYMKWGSPVVKSYHVFATPTIYLLDNKREIILRPNSVRHLDSWVDWFLINKQK